MNDWKVGHNKDRGDDVWLDENGEFHREDGPAVIRDGYKAWCIHGENHREDGPAVITDQTTEWWINGGQHREDGPAVEWDDGSKWWCLNHELVYSDLEDNTKDFELSDLMKKQIIKYKLEKM